MTNHIHFLVTPDKPDLISKTMQMVGSRYGYYFNRTYRRSGTVWEDWHKSSPVQSEPYLLTCKRYIELNPVVADMVATPEQYRWSSYLVNAWVRESGLVFHPEYLELGATDKSRCSAYWELFTYQLSEHDIHLIENASEYCHPVSDDRFREQIEDRFGICLGQTVRGRPRKMQIAGQIIIPPSPFLRLFCDNPSVTFSDAWIMWNGRRPPDQVLAKMG